MPGRSTQRERWPPPTPISPAGRIAGLTTTGSVLAAGLAWLAVSVRVLLCTRGCTVAAGAGGLVAILVAGVVIAAAALLRATLPRPLDPEAGSGWVYGLGVIFAVGVIAAASGIPDLVCPAGTKLSFFGFCAGPHSTRLAATSWTWLRRWIDVAGIVLGGLMVGFAALRTRRWVVVTAPIAALVWLAGTTALLLRTVGSG